MRAQEEVALMFQKQTEKGSEKKDKLREINDEDKAIREYKRRDKKSRMRPRQKEA